ncbi:hypothetical protein A33Q_0100 [Indibacter alkaliphilus LW1]|uniref:Uncharacterized protein n=1 Tax=Indibacter alkaliphilus (strain CCUG 57479 / KCTC 22604 / LW1) TaxID=1189612 RepID=S2ECW0_INDAL|nr:hypothetical protein A33Q_0100 [Indibacter alkaliphilus LW1]
MSFSTFFCGGYILDTPAIEKMIFSELIIDYLMLKVPRRTNMAKKALS